MADGYQYPHLGQEPVHYHQPTPQATDLSLDTYFTFSDTAPDVQQSHATSSTPGLVTSASTPSGPLVAHTPVEQPFAGFTKQLLQLAPMHLSNTLSVTFSEPKKPSKSPNFTFSRQLNKLFCRNVTAVTFQLHTASPIPPGSSLLAAAWKNGIIVHRCPNHQFKEEESEVRLYDTDKKQFIVSQGSQYVTKSNAASYLSLPIGDGQSTSFNVVLYFMCFSSCSTVGRKELKLELKIEHAGSELCHTSLAMRVCACPGRDRQNFEDRDCAEKEEQGGSAAAYSPFPTATPVSSATMVPLKREHENDDRETVRHQIIIEGPQSAVRECLATVIAKANQRGVRVGGAELQWYTAGAPLQDTAASVPTTTTSLLAPPAMSHPPQKKAFC